MQTRISLLLNPPAAPCPTSPPPQIQQMPLLTPPLPSSGHSSGVSGSLPECKKNAYNNAPTWVRAITVSQLTDKQTAPLLCLTRSLPAACFS